MAQYLLSVMEPTGGTPDPDLLRQVVQDVEALDRTMHDEGVWVFAGGLHSPSTATVLRAQDGQVVVTDGPFAEGKEHLGGFSVIDVDDLDAALEWGRRLAVATTLPIEVRPFRS
ncbi:hypothetical protein Cch01nite_27450 [Cellulomonas chitinilytica]|uniref:YCII-related domain-containing protein n=1 Tax=Cellulomonas chitinilytica TaxID=398759 RepID=A0A919P5J4_9CELL|nr:YciI family protein [Cellulomonas chitinilytica]GIG22021.1 hypothetical protein Cch01nite_27450 [Cellulomonas chitinilytica]